LGRTLTTLICAGKTELRQHRRLLECTDDDFLAQVIQESIRKGALLNLMLKNKEELKEENKQDT